METLILILLAVIASTIGLFVAVEILNTVAENKTEPVREDHTSLDELLT